MAVTIRCAGNGAIAFTDEALQIVRKTFLVGAERFRFVRFSSAVLCRYVLAGILKVPSLFVIFIGQLLCIEIFHPLGKIVSYTEGGCDEVACFAIIPVSSIGGSDLQAG